MGNTAAADSLGMVFIGYTLAAWLFGANIVQMYMYLQKCKDKLSFKAVVVVVFVSDMFNSIFSVWGIYLQLMQTPILPLKGEITLVFESTAADIAIFIVQCFFAQSVYQVSQHNKWLTGLIITLATLAFVSGMALSGVSATSLYDADGVKPVLNEVFVALALGLVTLTDIVITISLIRYLYESKSASRKTTNLLDSLIIYCVQRGILTTVSHVLVLVLWFTLPTEWTWTLFQFSLGKVYTLTFLILLNRRENLKPSNNRTQGASDLEFQSWTLGRDEVTSKLTVS